MNLKASIPEISEIIGSGGAGVIPTDTMYGMVASALDKKAVERLYELRDRDRSKPFLLLISSLDDILSFNPDMSSETRNILERIWPAPVSVILPVPSAEFDYIACGTGTIAMRLPSDEDLRELLSVTGPLVAPSVNPAGEKPAETLDEAWEYFPDLDFFIDRGTLPSNPSTLISIENGKAVVQRQGAWQVPDFLK